MTIVQTFFRDSFWGRVVYHLSHHKYNHHKVEDPGYVVPEKYYGHGVETSIDESKKDMGVSDSVNSSNNGSSSNSDEESTDTATGEITDSKGHIIVTWDGDDDPDDPHNWPFIYKAVFIFGISFLTISVYMASAIYTPGIEEIMLEFGIDQTVATLPLSLFVVGYGLGTNVLSPLSEHAKVGRTSIYIITLFFFFILQIPTALVKNAAGLIILRFLSGLFASATLATGGASVGDVLTLPYIPVGIAVWGMSAVCGPSLGPLIGSALVNRWDWRAPFWFVCIVSGVCVLYLGFFLPETYGKTILYRKAKALRAITGNENIVSEGELEVAHLNSREIALDILWRPIEIMIYEPVVLLIDLYIALIYSIMYLWFEGFPLVFQLTYDFTLVEMGVTYLAIAIGVGLGACIYIPIILRTFTKPIQQGTWPEAEVFIPTAIAGSVIMPCGLFIFAWTASPDVHWIGCLIGAGLFAVGAFMVFQTLFSYLSFSFPRYLASVFASNNLMRSNIAAFFPIIGQFLFKNLGTEKYPIAWGSMVLALICVGMILIPTLFYVYGRQLRARSKYAN